MLVIEDRTIVFGRCRKTGRALHVSEVARGEACECACPACGADLIAKKGAVKRHHFAHASGQECEAGYESSLHLFAKQILADRRELTLPGIQLSAATPLGRVTVSRDIGCQTQFDGVELERVVTASEANGKRIVADAIGFCEVQPETLVEFAVTHFCNQEKIDGARLLGALMVEIDLSGVRPGWSLDRISNAILHRTPRKWIAHPELIESEAELAGKVADAMQRAKLQAEEERRKEEERKRQRNESIEKNRDRALDAARRAKDINWAMPDSLTDSAIQERLAECRMTPLVGVQIAGGWSVEAHPVHWQSMIIEAYVLWSLRAQPRKTRWIKESTVIQSLSRWGFINDALLYLHKENESLIRTEMSDFVRPKHVVQSYLSRVLPWVSTERYMGRVRGGAGDHWWCVDPDTVCSNFTVPADADRWLMLAPHSLGAGKPVRGLPKAAASLTSAR